MINWQPYRLSLFVARHVQSRCQLCRYRLATVIDDVAVTDVDNLDAYDDSIFGGLNRLVNRGILCQWCHDSIHWLPKPFRVNLSYKIHTPDSNVPLNTGHTNSSVFPSQSLKSSINGLLTNNLSTNHLSKNNLSINHPQNQLIIQPVAPYLHPLKKVIQNFKFREDVRMLPILWHAVCQLPVPKGCHQGNSVILPMPTTDARVVERGFDPLGIITPYLSEHWQIPIWQGVARVDDTVSQRGLSRIERQQNIKGAFTVIESIPVRNVILFDDVATTGSSLQELANTLLSVDNSLHLRAYSLAHGNTIH